MKTLTKKQREEEKQKFLEYLHDVVKPGDTLKTLVTHVSRSGMSRSIRVFKVKDNEILDLTYNIGKLLGLKFDADHGGVKVSGCGMDMGFSLVYDLSCSLFPEGYTCLGDSELYKNRCSDADHSNGDRDYTPHKHNNGGYALRQEWL